MPQAPDQFWILVDNRPVGPITLPDLQVQHARGEVTAGTRICRVGSDEWQPLHCVIRAREHSNHSPPAARPSSDRPAAASTRPSPSRREPMKEVSQPVAGFSRTARRGLGRRRFLGVGGGLILLGAGYTVLRPRLAGALAPYERGYGDTVLRYADRSYEQARWTRLKEVRAIAEMS